MRITMSATSPVGEGALGLLGDWAIDGRLATTGALACSRMVLPRRNQRRVSATRYRKVLYLKRAFLMGEWDLGDTTGRPLLIMVDRRFAHERMHLSAYKQREKENSEMQTS